MKLILELKSEDILSNEFSWISLLKFSIDERFNVRAQLHELRTIRVQDGIVKKRIDEIDQHRNLLERHIKVISEKLVINSIIIVNNFRLHKKKVRV